jgi:hypothetical protein
MLSYLVSIALSTPATPPPAEISSLDISKLAKESTIKIASPTTIFSGTIVHRRDNIYTVITSAAPFKADRQSRYLATGSDNRSRWVSGVKFWGDNLDIATFQFTSGRSYRVAKFARNIGTLKAGTVVYIAGYGYSNSTTIDTDKALFNITAGKLISNSRQPIDKTGASIVYDNATLLGQGGGGIWNSRAETIGIHTGRDLGNEVVASPINPDIRQVKAKRTGISIDTIRQVLSGDRDLKEI